MNQAMTAAQYRNYQQTQRSPHTAGSRRGPGTMTAGAHHTAQTQQLMAQRQVDRASADKEMADRERNRAKKPTDRNMPDGVEEFIVGDGVQEYKKLRDMERRLDAVMMRKRLELQEQRPQAPERTRTLRVWISNTVENQPWQEKDLGESTFDFNTGMESTYKVQIVGRLLDNGREDVDDSDDESTSDKPDAGSDPNSMDHDGDGSAAKRAMKPAPSRQRLSHFFKEITVDYDRTKNFQADGATLIEWKKRPIQPNLPNPPADVDFDSLEFERKSDENINCTISLLRDETPERFALSAELSEVIDCKEATREAVVAGIWDYIKAMDLQQDEEKRLIQCDDRLRAVFKQDTVFFPHVANFVSAHLSPLPPIKLPYTIRVDPEYQASPKPTIYDILVPAPNLLHDRMKVVMENPSFPDTLDKIKALDDELAEVIQAISSSKARHSFFSSMSKDPTTFIKRWVSSQKKDMEIILGDSRIGDGKEWMGEEFRRGGRQGVWGSDNVRESVGLMVAKPIGR